MTSRRQATLYLPTPQREPIEALRARFNPAQHALIRAHATLCREDEVPDWDDLAVRLASLGAVEVTLAFGRPIREGDLVYLPSVDVAGSFERLRAALLPSPRRHRPHITLIHPRNGRCADADLEAINEAYEPFSAVFRSVALIEQVDGGRWRELAVFE